MTWRWVGDRRFYFSFGERLYWRKHRIEALQLRKEGLRELRTIALRAALLLAGACGAESWGPPEVPCTGDVPAACELSCVYSCDSSSRTGITVDRYARQALLDGGTAPCAPRCRLIGGAP